LCYSIHLQSNVALYLDHGATILAADTSESGSYDAPEPNAPFDKWEDFGHSHWHNSLIWGENLENVSILGPGLIHGKGLSRGQQGRLAEPSPSPSFTPVPQDPRDTLIQTPRENTRPRANDTYPSQRDTLRDGIGNKSIALKNCRNVILRDFSILHGGHFGILATGVDNLTIDNLKIDTQRDGMDIDCCRNVRVSNCSVNSPWDDGICLKASYGLGFLRATENVTITNCYVTGIYREGTMLDGTWKTFAPGARVGNIGRIKFGTESNGDFKNIAISNCVFDHCRGLAIESVDGSHIEDVSISNITMRDIVNAPIFIRLGSRLRGPDSPPVGTIRRVNISNIVCSNANWRYGSIISGIPGHPIEDLQISNIRFVQQGGGAAVEAALEPPEHETIYPEPAMFGTMPSSGFFIRHARNVEMHHAEVSFTNADARSTFVLQDVTGADFDHVKADRSTGAPFFTLRDVSDFTVHNSQSVPDTHRDKVEKDSL
jgi:polygalacturonase